MNRLKAYWASLPHPVQAVVILFVTTAGTTVAHSIEDGIVPHTWADAKHMLGTALGRGNRGGARLLYAAQQQNQPRSSTSADSATDSATDSAAVTDYDGFYKTKREAWWFGFLAGATVGVFVMAVVIAVVC